MTQEYPMSRLVDEILYVTFDGHINEVLRRKIIINKIDRYIELLSDNK